MTMSKELEELATKEKRAKYYQTFKSKHPIILTEKIGCGICNGHFTYHHKYRHNKSKKHLKALSTVHETLLNNEIPL